MATLLYGRLFYKALGTRNIFTAGSVDQMPKHFSSGYLFGDPLTIPIPDVDRTDYLLLLGANPLVSNGSLMTAPDMRGRLKAIRARGGRIVVVDPRRTMTAEAADDHLAIRPGTDALLLAAMAQVLFDEALVRLRHLADHVTGLDEVRDLVAPFTPDAVAPAVGIAADEIRRVTRELAGADRAAVYGRIGTTTQSFGTLASWLVDVLNVLTGNLDREGGAMFPLGAAGQTNVESGRRRGFMHGRWRSRVRDLPEVMGELPVATLADEITTPGDGQVRALFTVGGNPCLSTPNSARLDAALDQLDFMVSLDVYLNETTRHADVILPGPLPLERSHFDMLFYQLSVRNVANWTPAALECDLPQEWQTMLRLVGIVNGSGPDVDVAALDDAVAAAQARRAGLDPLLAGGRSGPARLVDLMLRAGPYDLTLADLEAAPHGIDLGPLRPRLPGVLATQSGQIELAPAAITVDVARLRAELERAAGSARADRPPAAALEQLVDAQPGATGPRQQSVHRADAPGRRAAARTGGRSDRARPIADGRGEPAGRDHRLDPARSRQHPARLGARPAGHARGRLAGERRSQLEPARRRTAARRAERDRRPQRDPDRGLRSVLTARTVTGPRGLNGGGGRPAPAVAR